MFTKRGIRAAEPLLVAVMILSGFGAATYGYLPPADAKYFTQVSFALGLNPVERYRLNQTGFVETDRLAFENFQTAYAYIYWKDLPVLITTDSLLQVVPRPP